MPGSSKPSRGRCRPQRRLGGSAQRRQELRNRCYLETRHPLRTATHGSSPIPEACTAPDVEHPAWQGLLYARNRGVPLRIRPLKPLRESSCLQDGISKSNRLSGDHKPLREPILNPSQEDFGEAKNSPGYVTQTFEGTVPLVYLKDYDLSTLPHEFRLNSPFRCSPVGNLMPDARGCQHGVPQSIFPALVTGMNPPRQGYGIA